ncbi:MAG: ABC transporter ATP-binding protein [candidate division WOR-3 bacterium]
MSEDNLITLREIKFGYNGKPLLFNGLNFSLHKDERIGIIGPNGCGKTTLFNIIMGFVKPVSGVIEIMGKEMREEKDFQKVRQCIGFLFQNSDDQLFCPSVREEVAFGPLNLRLSKTEVEERIRWSLKLVGLTGLEDRAPYNLSEGEKKRLAFATVLAMKPKILLLDEPTNGVDPEGVGEIERILLEGDYSYIVISQDMDFLKKTTETIYRLEKGKLKSL